MLAPIQSTKNASQMIPRVVRRRNIGREVSRIVDGITTELKVTRDAIAQQLNDFDTFSSDSYQKTSTRPDASKKTPGRMNPVESLECKPGRIIVQSLGKDPQEMKSSLNDMRKTSDTLAAEDKEEKEDKEEIVEKEEIVGKENEEIVEKEEKKVVRKEEKENETDLQRRVEEHTSSILASDYIYQQEINEKTQRGQYDMNHKITGIVRQALRAIDENKLDQARYFMFITLKENGKG